METVTLARSAMATRFELVLHGTNAVALRAAGEEALAEIDRVENQLSLYRPGSEIAQLNSRAAREPVQVSPEVFALLQHAAQLTAETEGAFDITIAPLVRCWGFMNASGKMPAPEEIATARALVGLGNVIFDASARTVRFARPGVMLDLGAIGKGYAIERSAMILRDAGVESVLIHGGTSSACAIGHPPDAEHWRVALPEPPAPTIAPPGLARGLPNTIRLRDESVSVSAIWGRAFEMDGKVFGHVIDPRLGHPVNTAVLSAVILPTTTETDALSTALLTLGLAGHDMIFRLRPGIRSLVVNPEGEVAMSPTWG
jgi:thiamine biosynthesis lipoprotein